MYIAIGGKGKYKTGTASFSDADRVRGGYNGGGRGFQYPSGSSGGGGATDFRLLANDLWHRVLVAGAGGGTDDQSAGGDDGTAGAGGNTVAQGYWVAGEYTDAYVATQTAGYSFGTGEAAQQYGSIGNGSKGYYGEADRGGAGGGWFGGFASHRQNGGAGGGSSFAFTRTATIPEGQILATNDVFGDHAWNTYAFSQQDDKQYLISNPVFAQGIWAGNGKAIITVQQYCVLTSKGNLQHSLSLLIMVLIISK